MAKVNWTNEAEIWLLEIYDYIAADNPNAAEKTVEAIYFLLQEKEPQHAQSITRRIWRSHFRTS